MPSCCYIHSQLLLEGSGSVSRVSSLFSVKSLWLSIRCSLLSIRCSVFGFTVQCLSCWSLGRLPPKSNGCESVRNRGWIINFLILLCRPSTDVSLSVHMLQTSASTSSRSRPRPSTASCFGGHGVKLPDCVRNFWNCVRNYWNRWATAVGL